VLEETRPSILATFHRRTDGRGHELDGSIPPDLRFPIASVTKTLTALLAARLCVDGTVAWDEPLVDPVANRRPVSLRTLLTHTAGLPSELHPHHWRTASLTEAELTTALRHPPQLDIPPHTSHYSNLGYGFVARVLERATDRPYAELLTEQLLRPLGMTHTSLPDATTEGTGVLGAAAAAGDVWSNLNDLMTLAGALDGREPDVITPTMLSLLLETVTPGRDGTSIAAGLRVHPVGASRVLVSTGTILDRTTCIVVWPRRGASVLVADRSSRHDLLRDAAIGHWRRDDTPVRTWWWDAQEVLELRHGPDIIELLLVETSWPFPLFSGRLCDEGLVGVDWRGAPLTLANHHSALVGDSLVLTADAADSAYPTGVLP
jgi:CubicO group peptidase (beta-lactamase class C family)